MGPYAKNWTISLLDPRDGPKTIKRPSEEYSSVWAMLRDAWDGIKLRVSISRLYWLYMQNNTILIPIHDGKIYNKYEHWAQWAVLIAASSIQEMYLIVNKR